MNDEWGEEIPACEAGFDTGKGIIIIITPEIGFLWIFISQVNFSLPK